MSLGSVGFEILGVSEKNSEFLEDIKKSLCRSLASFHNMLLFCGLFSPLMLKEEILNPMLSTMSDRNHWMT